MSIIIKRECPGTRRTPTERLYEHVLVRLLNERAINKQQFQDKLLQRLMPALEHVYYVNLAEKLGETEHVEHWKREAPYLLYKFWEFAKNANVKGCKKRLEAALEVIDELKSIDVTIRKSAVSHVRQCYGYEGKRLPASIDDNVSDEFFVTARNKAEDAIRLYNENGDAQV